MSTVLPDLPRRLYKYFGAARADVLRTRMLRFSPLGAFNDPFEGRPFFAGVATKEEMVEAYRVHMHEKITSKYVDLVREGHQLAPLEQWFEIYKKEFARLQEKFLEQASDHILKGASVLYRKFDESLGALCLCEAQDNLLMWSHYADSHAGFAVEFDSTSQFFDQRRSPSDEMRHVRRVRYRDTRPNLPLSQMDTVELFFVKSAHWAYEREWRVLQALADASHTVSADPFPIHLFSFPPNAVTAVVLGARCTAAVELEVREHLKEADLSHVQLKRAVPDESHFMLRFVNA